MFCTSLRKRSDLQVLLPLLLNSATPKLKESKLQTHDLALPIQFQPQPEPQPTPPILRVLVLTPLSLSPTNEAPTLTRIERFSALTGGRSIAIAFLLSTTSISSPSGMHAFFALQLHLLTPAYSHSPVPILPISTPSDLLPSLITYTTTLTHYTSQPLTPPPISPRVALLPHATSSAPQHPLPEHEANVLSDICGSLDEVARLTETEQGRAWLRKWVGARAGGVEEFWAGEREV